MNKEQSENECNFELNDQPSSVVNADSSNSLTNPKDVSLATVKLKRLSKSNKSVREEASAPPPPLLPPFQGIDEELSDKYSESDLGPSEPSYSDKEKLNGKNCSESYLHQNDQMYPETILHINSSKHSEKIIKSDSSKRSVTLVQPEANLQEDGKQPSGTIQHPIGKKCSQTDIQQSDSKKPSDYILRSDSRKPSESIMRSNSKKPSESILPSYSAKYSESDLHPENKKPTESVLPSNSAKYSESELHPENKKPSESVLPSNSAKYSDSELHPENKKPSESILPSNSAKYSERELHPENKGPSESVLPSNSAKYSESELHPENKKTSESVLPSNSARYSESELHPENKKPSESVLPSNSAKYSESELLPENKKPSESFLPQDDKKPSDFEMHPNGKKYSQTDLQDLEIEGEYEMKSNLIFSAYNEEDLIENKLHRSGRSIQQEHVEFDDSDGGLLFSKEETFENNAKEDMKSKSEDENETETGSKQKPVLLSDEDAECLFGWSLLSPGVMEIKMVPGSDDPADIIRIRRTPSFQCFLESGDLEKFQHLREQDKKEEFNEYGELEYTDVLRMTTKVEDEEGDQDKPLQNPKFEEIKTEAPGTEPSSSLFKQEEDDDCIELNPQIAENIERTKATYEILMNASASIRNQREKLEDTFVGRDQQEENDDVDVLEGPKRMNFPSEKDDTMYVKYILPSDSGVLTTKGKEDGEVCSTKQPDQSEIEEARNLTKETSMMSLQPRSDQSSTSKKKKRDTSKGGKSSSLRKSLKGKKSSQSADETDAHSSKKEEKKKRSWFRFWF